MSHYISYIDGYRERLPNYPPPFIAGRSQEALNRQERAALFERELNATIARLIAADKAVVLVYPVPDIGYNVPTAIQKPLVRSRDPATLYVPLVSFRKRNDIVFRVLDGIGTSSRILRIYPHKKLCELDRCRIYANGKALYTDSHHLSWDGTNLVLPAFEPVFENEALTDRAGTALAILPTH